MGCWGGKMVPWRHHGGLLGGKDGSCLPGSCPGHPETWEPRERQQLPLTKITPFCGAPALPGSCTHSSLQLPSPFPCLARKICFSLSSLERDTRVTSGAPWSQPSWALPGLLGTVTWPPAGLRTLTVFTRSCGVGRCSVGTLLGL